MMHIAAFDFDGTITRGDTLIEFLKFTHKWRFYLWFFVLSPVLVLMKLGVVRNDTAKQLVLSCFFKGWSVDRFDQACCAFAPTIQTRAAALECLQRHLAQGDQVVIVSASPEGWVRQWAKANGVAEVLATRLEVIGGRLTGGFATPNCYGAQKVVRLCAAFPELEHNRSSVELTAYGDSSGDRAMIEFSDHAHYKIF